MAANTIDGQDFNLFLTVSGSTKKTVGLATGVKVAVSFDEKNITTKDSGAAAESKPGRYKYTISVDSLLSQDAGVFNYDFFFDKMMTKTVMTWALGKTTGVIPQVLGTGKQLSGSCWISKMDLDSKDDDNVSFTMELVGSGVITHA